MRTVKRIFVPGSEWLYFKIYSGPKMAEKLLINYIYKIILDLDNKKKISKFFFVRYSDPDFHIRLRFLVTNQESFLLIVTKLNYHLKSLIINNIITKIQIDTYVREIDRYTSPYIEFSEALFYVDSIYVLKILKYISKLRNENYRWMTAIKLIDSMISEFGLTMEERYTIFSSLDANYMKEFGFDEYNSKQFNSIYRKWKFEIEEILQNKFTDKEFVFLDKCIIDRSKSINEIMIRFKITKIEIINIIPDFIHMTLNRIFCVSPRLHELILYNMVKRYYGSQIKKEFYSAKGIK